MGELEGMAVGRVPLGKGGAITVEATQTTCLQEALGGIDCRDNRTHLSNIQVVAHLVDLRVVGGENSGIHAECFSDPVASIIPRDDIGVLAVLARRADTEDLAGHEIVALAIDLIVIEGCKLVTRGNQHVVATKGPSSRRDIVLGRNAVANIALLDGIETITVGRKLGRYDCGGT